MILSLIVAADENNVIGRDNKLPWHLPNDLKYFKNITWGMPVVMGRKTFESIGKPLPGRTNIVVTRNMNWKGDGAIVVHQVNEAIEVATSYDVIEIYIIGGAALFATTLADANRLYLTRIHHQFEGDVFFPAIDEKIWLLKKETFCDADEKNAFPHTFQFWERKDKE
ncbi:MAG: dihydrofolate reductase [Chitinophagaceae bacterium]